MNILKLTPWLDIYLFCEDKHPIETKQIEILKDEKLINIEQEHENRKVHFTIENYFVNERIFQIETKEMKENSTEIPEDQEIKESKNRSSTVDESKERNGLIEEFEIIEEKEIVKFNNHFRIEKPKNLNLNLEIDTDFNIHLEYHFEIRKNKEKKNWRI